MSTSRLADRQIRAAAHAALRLDVRGPVSEALGKTGIAVPPVDEAPAPAPAPERTVGRAPARKKTGLTPTLKPIAEAPWPTRAAADPLSGLTADERRVHRILLDTLDLTSRHGDLGAGLSYAERQRLEALDLAFINAQLAKAEAGPGLVDRTAALAFVFVGGVLLALALGGAASSGALVAGGVFAVLFGLAARAGLIPEINQRAALPAQKKKIYEALRELALLVEPAPTSEALAEADRLIDTLADADLRADRPRQPSRVRP